jgi:glutamate-1-semialdehyde 2,1-aminomutase
LEVVDFATAKTADIGRFNQHFHSMLQQGVYLAPSQFEAAFISAAHTTEDVDYTIRAARN